MFGDWGARRRLTLKPVRVARPKVELRAVGRFVALRDGPMTWQPVNSRGMTRRQSRKMLRTGRWATAHGVRPYCAMQRLEVHHRRCDVSRETSLRGFQVGCCRGTPSLPSRSVEYFAPGGTIWQETPCIQAENAGETHEKVLRRGPAGTCNVSRETSDADEDLSWRLPCRDSRTARKNGQTSCAKGNGFAHRGHT